MKGNLLLISGSASRSCLPEQLARAIQFIELLTAQALRAGGGLVVLLGDENPTKGADGNPRTFDWTVMRAIERYAAIATASPRIYARVVIAIRDVLATISAGCAGRRQPGRGVQLSATLMV